MRKNPPKCRYCQREVMWAVVGVKAHDDDTMGPNRRAFDLNPVPTATCAVMAVVLSRGRGLQDVHTVANPPPECYPVHRCPQYLEALVLQELEQLRLGTVVAGLADAAADAQPIRASAVEIRPRRRDANAS